MSALNYAPLEALLFALAVSCQFYAALRVGERRITPKVWALLATGLAFTAAFASVEYRMLPSFSEVSLLVKQRPALRELPPDWGVGLAPEQRALSIVLARSAYENHGKLIEYVERDGRRVRFAPTEADIESRAKVLAVDMSLDTRTELLSASWRRWLTSTLGTLLFGYLVGRMGAGRKNAGA